MQKIHYNYNLNFQTRLASYLNIEPPEVWSFINRIIVILWSTTHRLSSSFFDIRSIKLVLKFLVLILTFLSLIDISLISVLALVYSLGWITIIAVINRVVIIFAINDIAALMRVLVISLEK